MEYRTKFQSEAQGLVLKRNRVINAKEAALERLHQATAAQAKQMRDAAKLAAQVLWWQDFQVKSIKTLNPKP